MTKVRLQLTFYGLATVAFILSTTVADVVARVSVGGEPVGEALSESFGSAGIPVLGLVMIAVPFVALAWVGVHLALRNAFWWGLLLAFVGMSCLVLLYFQGFHYSQVAILQRKWTAAALSVGLIPFFYGVPITLLAIAIRFIVVPRLKPRRDEA